nr:AC4 [Tomato leaf curl New Delhi virus]
MGLRISMFSSNSKENSNAKITDPSSRRERACQTISIRTFRELNQRQMSRYTSTKTETF